MAAPLVSNISDTARWIAALRAVETRRPDAIFRDPYAEMLAGEAGERMMRGLSGAMGAPGAIIARTKLLDDMVEHLVAQEELDQVINLAAGLDTRPYRLDLPEELGWVEVDLPPILEEKTRALASAVPRCRLSRRALDLTDRPARQALFEELGASSGRTLVITEGLLVYLTAEQAAALADDLQAVRSFRFWAMDLLNDRLLAFLQRRVGNVLAAGNAPMKFGPRERFEFFASHGWRVREEHPTFEESLRLKRGPPFAWLFSAGMGVANALGRQSSNPWSAVGLLERSE